MSGMGFGGFEKKVEMDDAKEMTKTLEQKADEAAARWLSDAHITTDAINARADFAEGYFAAAEPRDKEIAALRAELADRDTVPRSRYNACNQDQLDADRALTHLRDVAKREITDRDKEIATLRARVAELEGMVR